MADKTAEGISVHQMQRLQHLAQRYGPLCVGLDTDPAYFPDKLLAQFPHPADAVLTYNREIIKRIVREGSACCFKIQIAYYEALGLEGMRVFAETLRMARESGLVAISDIKRGDIANTADAYARAHFSGDFETDSITVNPFMGFDTLEPFLKFAAPSGGGKGIFVLLRTSNPGAKDIERLELAQGGTVVSRVGAELLRIADKFAAQYADCSCSPVGAVVGCTEESDARALREAYPHISFLIPGYGAQGGSARVAAILLDKAGGTVNSSRAILCAWQKDAALAELRERGGISIADMADAAARAAASAKADLLEAMESVR